MMKLVKKYLIPNQENDWKPHLLRKGGIAAVSIIAIALFAVGVFQSTLFLRTDFLSAVLPKVLVQLANADREEEQIGNLTVNPTLEAAAQMKANDMAEKGYFAHNTPDGKTPWYWFAQAGYKYVYAGENLAVNFSDSEDVNRAWMNSPGHRANILNGRFTEIGIATAKGTYKGKSTVFVVQLFGRPSASPSAVVATLPQTETEEIPVESETPVAGAQNPPKTTVLGETAETEAVPVVTTQKVLAQSETFIAVENTADTMTPISDPAPAPQPSETVTAIEKIATSPKQVAQIIFLTLAGIVIVAIAFLIGIEIKRQHPKNVSAGLVLLMFIIALLYISQTYIFGQVIVV